MRQMRQFAEARTATLSGTPLTRRMVLAAALTVLWILPLLLSNTLVNTHARPLPAPSRPQTHSAPAARTGAWAGDTQVTPVKLSSATLATAHIAVDAQLEGYYVRHNGLRTLGAALTPAYPIREGLVQFFDRGALLLPADSVGRSGHESDVAFGDLSQLMYSDGQADTSSGIIELPMLHALITIGSQVPVAGESSTLTYADLRTATVQVNLRQDMVRQDVAPETTTSAQPYFEVRNGTSRSITRQFIPDAIWTYITRPDVSPAGWEQTFGLPLTPALPLTVTQSGVSHQVVVQAFWRGVLLLDPTAPQTSAEAVQRVNTGAAYIRALGPLGPVIRADSPAWVRGPATVLTQPGTGTASVHLGENFPLFLTGKTLWQGMRLWYETEWRGTAAEGLGWLDASNVTFVPPAHDAPAFASFDAFSAELAAYLGAHGSQVGAVLYDVTHQQYYTYNPDSQFIVASSVKVPIMLTLLTLVEQQGRDVNDYEMSLLVPMIEQSDNDAAQALWEEIGGVDTVSAFLRGVGITDFSGNYDAWGWSTISPRAMVKLLTLLHDGKVLTAQHRALALSLMENIVPDQRAGVGDTAPAGARVAMKDGWVQGPDGLWAMNTSGIVTTSSGTYIISVYTQEDDSLDSGWDITRSVCQTAANLLT